MTEEDIKKLIAALQSQGTAVGDLSEQLQALTDAQLAQAEAAAKAAEVSKEKAAAALQQEIEYRSRATEILDVQNKKILEQLNITSDEIKRKELFNQLDQIKIEQLQFF